MRCAIVLSGGIGARLRHVVSRICGYDLPKQYVNFIGKRSMLEHTFQRAQSLIPCERLFTVITRFHLNFSEVLRQIGGRPPDTVIVQPENKDTAPGVLLPLIYLYKRFPNASVALFPSDH